jgi:hypothetical protein
MNSQGFSRPGGDIVTLLDLTPRDFQDGEFTPLQAEKTWWLPDQTRRLRPFSLTTQSFPIRGPTSFGQHFVFDIGSTNAGDLLFSSVIQVELGHWLNDTTILRLESGKADYRRQDQHPIEDPWFYANGLGSVILQKAWLEIGDQTIEEVDGDFLNVASLLFQDINQQFGFANDGLGRRPVTSLLTTPVTQPFPTLSRTLFIPLPFFFQRIRLQEALPLLACKENSVRLHIQFRPFEECVRRLRGRRVDCKETPLNRDIELLDLTTKVQIPIVHHTPVAPPLFKSIELITYGANLDGTMRQRVLRDPFEILHRQVKTFHFEEPLKYATNKTTKDKIQVQLPLEVNHPMEEILWFVRRKATANNNEWTNYSAVMSAEADPIYNPLRPLLLSATIQLNGIDLISQEEQWFRQHIALKHKGGVAAFDSFIYGYSFASQPGEHQPSGTANASRLATVRLTLDVSPPGGSFEQEWEVKVFVVTLNWLRFQNGIANKMYQD